MEPLLLDSDLRLASATRPHGELLLLLHLVLNLLLLLQCKVLELNLKLELDWVWGSLRLRCDKASIVPLPLLVEGVQSLMVNLASVCSLRQVRSLD